MFNGDEEASGRGEKESKPAESEREGICRRRRGSGAQDPVWPPVYVVKSLSTPIFSYPSERKTQYCFSDNRYYTRL